MFLMGYIPSHNRVYLADKDVNIHSYSLSLSVVEYQTAILRFEMDAAAEILPTLPKEQLNKVARFLEGRGTLLPILYKWSPDPPSQMPDLKELAMEVTTDPDHKFDLALQLDDLDTALTITQSVPELEAEAKWKALGDRALAVWRFDLAKDCFERAGDLGALTLLLLATGDREGLKTLVAKAGEPRSIGFFFSSTLILACL
jgi:coatomer subunit beta'